jgi:hypothetical protein
MPQTVRSQNEEYWRPADPVTARIARPILAESLCPDCRAVYASEARYCHMCGMERNRRPVPAPKPPSLRDSIDEALNQRFHLSTSSLIFLTLGVICLVIGAFIGIFYKASTLMEWQAIQTWRVEWLLGAAAAMLAGILLKKK